MEPELLRGVQYPVAISASAMPRAPGEQGLWLVIDDAALADPGFFAVGRETAQRYELKE
jgi:hypothetical protein